MTDEEQKKAKELEVTRAGQAACEGHTRKDPPPTWIISLGFKTPTCALCGISRSDFENGAGHGGIGGVSYRATP